MPLSDYKDKQNLQNNNRINKKKKTKSNHKKMNKEEQID